MGPDITKLSRLFILEFKYCFEYTHGESRTHNPPIRSRMPCPLGHAGAIKTKIAIYVIYSQIIIGFLYVSFVAAIHARRLDSVNSHIEERRGFCELAVPENRPTETLHKNTAQDIFPISTTSTRRCEEKLVAAAAYAENCCRLTQSHSCFVSSFLS
jgi:hypothetical protein